MSVNLKVTLGTVNFTDWLHVTASKVPLPSVTVWETWIDMPVTNYNFVIPGLDPENYYVRYYDAPTNVSLGSLVAELLVNALTGDIIYERRFYTVGGPGTYDPIAGSTLITDPYLAGKSVTGVFKEGFRYLKETEEYMFDDAGGEIEIVNGTIFSDDEKIILELKYSGGAVASTTSSGLYTGDLTVTAATKTLLAADVDKRIRCKGSASTQVITVCLLATIAAGRGFYFDNSVGGTAVQVKILFQGSDKLVFNGFATPSDVFTEFWVGKGEHLLIRKFLEDDGITDFWEVITDYKGVNVGERMAAGYRAHPNTMSENNQLLDGDEYPRLYWWVKNVLPATHKYVTDAVTDPGFVPIANKRGQFAIHSTLKKFRMPHTAGLSEKGMTNFEVYGLDTANRPIDYPGGLQAEMVKAVDISLFVDTSGQSGGTPFALNRTDNIAITGARRGGGLRIVNGNGTKLATMGNGNQNRVENIGVVYVRRY